MPNAFNFSASPFDCLTQDEQRLVRSSVDIAYFRAGDTIVDTSSAPTHLYVVIKGYVTQQEGNEVLTTYGPDDCFDGRGLVAGKFSSRFVAVEEVVAYQLARQTVSDLIASNATFGALLFSDLSNKLSALSERNNRTELQSLTLARVDEAFLRTPHFVTAETDIVSVSRIFHTQRTSSVLVRDTASSPERLGIFTATALQRAILDGRALDSLAVGQFANYRLVEVQASDQLGEAMATMLRHRIHRVVVASEGKIVGILEALDLFSFLSNQSHLITERIEEAVDLAGLALAAGQITRMIASLSRSGTRVNLIAKLVQQLNARLFERAWQLTAPPELVSNSCLFVMGSEGRGEQLLKTDQDNALILRDGFVPPDNLQAVCDAFSKALADFGYPPCPGGIMVSSPEWRHTAADFGQMVRQWLLTPVGDSLMKLAMFMDAHAVCGDATLLASVREKLMALATDNDAVLARFAAVVEAFSSRGGWWNKLLGLGDEDTLLHVKKEGLFPIVHGIRSLALAHHLSDTGTDGRITALVAQGKLDSTMGTDLSDSLHFLMGIKLKAGLLEMDTGKPVSGAVDVARLSSLERDLLKDALAVVKRFKALLHQRFHLDAV